MENCAFISYNDGQCRGTHYHALVSAATPLITCLSHHVASTPFLFSVMIFLFFLEDKALPLLSDSRLQQSLVCGLGLKFISRACGLMTQRKPQMDGPHMAAQPRRRVLAAGVAGAAAAILLFVAAVSMAPQVRARTWLDVALLCGRLAVLAAWQARSSALRRQLRPASRVCVLQLTQCM